MKTYVDRISFTVLAVMAVSSCVFLEPDEDNASDIGILDEAAYFCGPLNSVYDNLPSVFDNSMDAMTDNAVIRDMSGDYYRCGIGAMSPNNNPLDIWTRGYENIRKLNIFLDRMVLDEDSELQTPVRFFPIESDADKQNNLNMFWRLKGEAYALRAYWMLELLKNFAGVDSDGNVLGVPDVRWHIVQSDDTGQRFPRASFDDCIEAIVEDCDSAVYVCKLPDLYNGGTDLTYGNSNRNHISGAAAKAIKARALLYAASPAYNLTDDAGRWELAAKAAAEAINAVGGINAGFSTREEYYFSQIENTDWGNYDLIFKGKVLTWNSDFERDNYPPQMYGNAKINVSQNLVDVFPDIDGYPVGESLQYDPEHPYDNRDPRLALFVGYDGGQIGSYVIDVSYGGKDAYDPLKKTSRSGYYLKKTLRESIVLDPGVATSTSRTNILIGLPELLLNFSEAANRAWGVTGDPEGLGFTAKDALTRIVTRENPDGANYLNDVIGSDSDLFDEYVRIQRRIELCFEGHYFYDLRRWHASSSDWEKVLNVPVMGIRYSGSGPEIIELERRFFESPYQPVPYSEILNAGLVQNKGWN